MTVRAYDSKEVTIAVGGVALKGFGDAELIVLAPLEDERSEYVGSDGEVTIAKNNNPVYRATINLAQSSESNDYLDSLIGDVFSFSINDLNGTTLVNGTAWIFRRPDVGFAKTVSTRAWQLGVEVTSSTIGGIPIATAVG